MIGSPKRRSSLLVSTTNGMLFAATVPNSGIESCHAERISSSMASKPSSTLSNSSMSSTQGRSHSSARIRGPGRKKSRPLRFVLDALPVFVLALRELHVEPLQALVEAADRLVLGDAAVALEPLDVRARCRSDRDG